MDNLLAWVTAATAPDHAAPSWVRLRRHRHHGRRETCACDSRSGLAGGAEGLVTPVLDDIHDLHEGRGQRNNRSFPNIIMSRALDWLFVLRSGVPKLRRSDRGGASTGA